MVEKKSKPTKKEKEMAQNLIQNAGFGCEEQSCKKIGPCMILCDEMQCKKFSDKARAVKGLLCPSQLKCPKFTCGEVTCSKLKK